MRRALMILLLVAALVVGTAARDAPTGAAAAAIYKTFTPPNRGAWRQGYSTDIYLIHSNVMKDGRVVGWCSVGKFGWGSVVCDPARPGAPPKCERLLGECGIHDCENAFCSGQVTTPDNKIIIFGGHGEDVDWMRVYDHTKGTVYKKPLSSPRWYPGAATLPDGKLMMVGGVKTSGYAGYFREDKLQNNPTFEVFDPATGELSGDKLGMYAQLDAAFPLSTYPQVHVTPDGGVVVSASKFLVKYRRTGAASFAKAFSFPDRPGSPWAYPQTGQGLPLPMLPPYDKMFLLSTGGSTEDYAGKDTPASNQAHIIELTGGREARWWPVGPMPHTRVMGDSIILCDGSILFVNGAGSGIAGWTPDEVTYKFPDGFKYKCKERCSKADRDGVWEHNEPVIFDPFTKRWSQKGSLASMVRPRLYHSSAVLLPNCQVMVGGSDVTNDTTAEFFSPPYLSLGPRPDILWGPKDIRPGQDIGLRYTSKDAVQRAILIRTSANTHSIAFDARALWLKIAANKGGWLKLETPDNRSVLPPGMYQVVILTDKGVPSDAHILSVY